MSTVTHPPTSPSSLQHTHTAAHILHRFFDNHPQRDFAVRLWDGSESVQPAAGSPRFTLVINHPGALRRMFLPPSEINLGEAFIFGDFDIEGEIIAAVGLMDYFPTVQLNTTEIAGLVGKLLSLPAARPVETKRPGLRPRGEAHSRRRDRETVQFHYDVSNDFYRLWLDEGLIYSCAYFKTGEEDIHLAQRQKLEHICRKLQLKPGERLLDIGCGWGSLVAYAAEHYGVEAVGITLSKNQVPYAREQIAAAGLGDQCEIRLQDYRDVPSYSFDKIVSVGMVEHVGARKLPTYFREAWRLLRPGGLFLNHAIGSMTSHLPQGSLGRALFRRNSFMNRYVFPDGELVDIHHMLREAEKIGFEVRDMESLREHYALTLRHWVRRLEANHHEARQYVDEPTYRVWRLYMAGCSYSFARSRINVYQSLLAKNTKTGESGLPWTRAHLYEN